MPKQGLAFGAADPEGVSYEVERCQRCGGDLGGVSIMSFFDTSIICLACQADEKLAPSYEAAHAREVAEVRAGNYNFRGTGLTPEDRKFLAEKREVRKYEGGKGHGKAKV